MRNIDNSRNLQAEEKALETKKPLNKFSGFNDGGEIGI